MKSNITIKKLISIFVVVMLFFAICITPAHDDSPSAYFQRSRAFIGAALAALNITINSTQMNALSVLEYVADPLNVNYTYMDAWRDRPEIQIWPDYTVIDGQKYTDVWISNEAAEKFRVDAFDFKTAYAITSNSQGNIASGIGHVGDVPLFNLDGTSQSQNMIISDNGTYNTGGYSVSWSGGSGPSSYKDYAMTLTTPSGYVRGPSSIRVYSDHQRAARFRDYGGGYWIYEGGALNPRTNTISPADSVPVEQNTLDLTPFDFNYVSTDIPANQQLPSDTGMMIRVPSDDGHGNNYFDQFLTDNPEFNQGEPVSIDVNLDPDIMMKLDDLIDIIAPIIPIINNQAGDVTFIENHTAPEPQPDHLLPDTYWSQLEHKLDEIRQTIQNLNPDFSQIIQQIQTIPSTIQTIGGNIINTIQNLGDTILQDIEQGPIKVIDKGIDLLKSIFLPILTLLKNALGIWHYVVEWLGNISAPFTWVLGIMSSTSGILMSPIYACFAGAIVIAVYRRFGQ